MKKEIGKNEMKMKKKDEWSELGIDKDCWL